MSTSPNIIEKKKVLNQIYADKYGLIRSPQEEKLLIDAPFKADEAAWALFCSTIIESVLVGYRDGEITFLRMIETVKNASIGCSMDDRVTMMGLCAARALNLRVKKLLTKSPPFPKWHKKAAVELVQMIEENTPELPRSPAESKIASRETSLSKAMEWLKVLSLHLGEKDKKGLRKPLEIRTLYLWVTKSKKLASSKAKR